MGRRCKLPCQSYDCGKAGNNSFHARFEVKVGPGYWERATAIILSLRLLLLFPVVERRQQKTQAQKRLRPGDI